MQHFDVVVIGAGAAGLMCAGEAGKRGHRVLLIEHNKKPGAKILISGGGRCNFTNLDVRAERFISRNPHFAKSALSRYSAGDFMTMMAAHGLSWHEKTLGQLFCDQKAGAVVDMLLAECRKGGVQVALGARTTAVSRDGDGFRLTGSMGDIRTAKLVLATGGLSIPKMGASDFTHRIARQFGLPLVPAEPALVPFTFAQDDRAFMAALSGVSQPATVATGAGKGAMRFAENLLFTHRGLSGPAILQISSYWTPDTAITVNLLADVDDVPAWLAAARQARPKAAAATILGERMPKRLADALTEQARIMGATMATLSNKALARLTDMLTAWRLYPAGTEGYAKAEVTKGGVDTAALNQKTMEVKDQPGLFIIGEAVDVTGWLGGYNFQWAWASGWAAGQAV
ncbi:NAD(P)/FAD-dependent oxidoreductase [Eilatimonas milleporae]|uniref:Aminoacetone oxidase family FAD-binding enzyme n=1 Tax=Eilatimonas milleporae TaxID=911205 RepID=A0A3M0C669_9PROT|nr:NAD(P)/FAD-dependent oxidoreductase [Eilatimonas milleporae]RMB04395.1 hypothetical protein BXY39_2656 [Eilatimonas milleporae]